ncbi:4Fe-4S binding protein, partial [Desulfosporosinus sp. BICA1-9]|uniref:4Fe-4S binding protein n=1 Tax=Desulfosporosinus sp. BICA1-9 TaxID=1531958 RepID=UPI00054AFCD5
MVLKLIEELCIGCRLCQLACSVAKEEVFNPELARLKIISIYSKTGLNYKTSLCNMCLTCVSICPTEAITHQAGYLIYDQDKCTNCGICITACPENVIASRAEGIALCDLCGGSPACVEWCPHQALMNQEGN